MERTAEMAENVERSSELSHLKSKEKEPSLRSDGHNLMESTSLFISHDIDWHKKHSLPKSSDSLMDSLKGKDPVRHTGSNSGPKSLGTGGPLDTDISDGNILVEELMQDSYYKHTSISSSLPGSSKTIHENLGGPKDAISKESGTVRNKVDVKNFSFNHLGAQRLNPSDCNQTNVIDHSSGNESPAISSSLRTKVLPASGFSQYLVRNTLKGKCVARHSGSYDTPKVALKSQNVEKNQNVLTKVLPTIFHDNTVNTQCADSQGVSLRHWLKPCMRKFKKAVRLQIFKKVVELVDSSHSEGIGLQQLRPSYLMLLPSKEVKYSGMFVSNTEMEQIDTIRNQASDHHYLPLKRQLDQNNQKYYWFQTKYTKLSGDVKVGTAPLKLFGGHGGMEGDLSKGCGAQSFIDRNRPGYDYSDLTNVSSNRFTEPMQWEERWYVSPEELNSSASSLITSNIYSLGVLLFELLWHFESLEEHAAAMLELRQRILPSNFLSESPKEAAFCLWLLHPNPSSRPKSREVLLCYLINGTNNATHFGKSSVSFEEDDGEAEVLQHFLLTLKEKKELHAKKLMGNIGCLSLDIAEVVKRHSSRVDHLSSDVEILDNKVSDKIFYKETSNSGKISMSDMKDERLLRNIAQLENAYFSMRSKIEIPETSLVERTNKDVLGNHGSNNELDMDDNSDRLRPFFDGLCKYARYNKFEVRGTLRNGDVLSSVNVICSLSFDRDEEYFAAAGVAKKIKIFEYASLLNDTIDIHYPVVEMTSKSNLTSVCWNSYIKNYLASTGYDGSVQLWDASTGQFFSQYREHQRRAWSVDFSHAQPTKFASGSDDCAVKLWSINEKNSTNTIRNVANVCCVQFSPYSTNLLAFGSSDYKIHLYDLRNTRFPWCTLVGHEKAVSYVKFVDSDTIVSASTDNTLKLWDLNNTRCSGFSTDACSLTFVGHTNERNFVGLSVSNGYIACGSETNEVYAYYKSLQMPITSKKFGSIDPISGQDIDDDNGQFVSSVCWREKSNMVVAANSSGCIKLLQMKKLVVNCHPCLCLTTNSAASETSIPGWTSARRVKVVVVPTVGSET